MSPGFLQNLIRLQNPFSVKVKGEGQKSERPANSLSSKLPAPSLKGSISPHKEQRTELQETVIPMRFTESKKTTQHNTAAEKDSTAVRNDISTLPLPDIQWNGLPINVDERDRSRARSTPDLPVLTVRWAEVQLTFRAFDPEFSRMSLEWNGPFKDEGKDFQHLLSRLKDYGIEEIFQNGRLISVERQA